MTERNIAGNEQKVEADVKDAHQHAFCPVCERDVEAYFELRQMRSADEPETKIFRCSVCKHVWRE